MRVVDIFPVRFQVLLSDLFGALTQRGGLATNTNTMPVQVDFLKGILEYWQKLMGIGINPYGGKLGAFGGVRVWVNNETNSSDGFQNNYKQNKIVESFNNALTSVSAMSEYSKSIGAISDPTQGTIDSPLAAALLDGRHLSLPNIWESSDYNPSLDLTVKLVSPYGNVKSFRKNIAEPLLWLTTLAAPSSYDGVTYGMPSNMYVRAYGISFIPLATANSFSVVRGGPSGRVNYLKQPLELSVSMQFKPAMPGFGAIIPPNTILGLTNALFGNSDPMGNINDVEKAYDISEDFTISNIMSGTKKIPGITTLGTIIQSLRPVSGELRNVPPSLLGNPTIPDMRTSTIPIGPTVNQQINNIVSTTADMLSEMGTAMTVDQLTSIMQNPTLMGGV
jgi:hypothetical protein